ncbi:hypothetical protein HYX16_05635 [Candidatus Woesearchaeota archaeon]|nr:hypothetical protein [Candidatus Woesearchaeota archaeon]
MKYKIAVYPILEKIVLENTEEIGTSCIETGFRVVVREKSQKQKPEEFWDTNGYFEVPKIVEKFRQQYNVNGEDITYCFSTK